jgi:hypothetical protein
MEGRIADLRSLMRDLCAVLGEELPVPGSPTKDEAAALIVGEGLSLPPAVSSPPTARKGDSRGGVSDLQLGALGRGEHVVW